MKKGIALFLVFLLLTGLMGCTGGTEDPSESDVTEGVESSEEASDETGENAVTTFSVGYGRAALNPDFPVRIGGYGNTQNRIATGSFNLLYASVTAISDGEGTTILMIALDLGNLGSSCGTDLILTASSATGIPKENIVLNTSHSHSTPDMSTTDWRNLDFRSYAAKQTALAAQEAVSDLKPASMYVGAAETEGLNYVRRYLMTDGTWAGDNYGTFTGKTIARHESDADPLVRMILFKREGARDVLLTNFQAHATVGSAGHKAEGIYYELSSDFVGSYREKIEREKDCFVSFFQGGAGNINPRSQISTENAIYDQTEYGETLASFVLSGYDSVKQVKTGKIQVLSETVKAEANHEEDSKIAIAREIVNYWTATDDSAGAINMGKEYDIYSPHHASAIIGKAGLGKTLNVLLSAFRIGDVAIASAPYEMFDTSANQIREGSHAEMTFVLAYSGEGYMGYLPDEEAWTHGGYEQYSSRFTRGAAELFVQKLVEMINQMD